MYTIPEYIHAYSMHTYMLYNVSILNLTTSTSGKRILHRIIYNKKSFFLFIF